MARSLTFGCYKSVERILLRAGAMLRPFRLYRPRRPSPELHADLAGLAEKRIPAPDGADRGLARPTPGASEHDYDRRHALHGRGRRAIWHGPHHDGRLA